MTEVEKRRITLLKEVRKNHSDRYAPPAVHPRYHSVYHALYQEGDDEIAIGKSTFLLRLIIAGLLFAFVFVMDYHKEEILHINSQVIVREIQKNLFSQ